MYKLKINYSIHVQIKKERDQNPIYAFDLNEFKLTLYSAVHTRCLSTTICSERREIYVKQDI